MMDAVMYGVILKAKIVKFENDPPEKRSNKSNNPVSPVNNSASAALLMLGTGMFEPILNTRSIISVKSILLLISGIFQA